jgi:hypothetical protein
MVRKKKCPNCGSRKIKQKGNEWKLNGNVTFAGLNFQERVEEEHLKKEGNNGEIRLSRFSRLRAPAAH